jgi:hypothetical protein
MSMLTSQELAWHGVGPEGYPYLYELADQTATVIVRIRWLGSHLVIEGPDRVWDEETLHLRDTATRRVVARKALMNADRLIYEEDVLAGEREFTHQFLGSDLETLARRYVWRRKGDDENVITYSLPPEEPLARGQRWALMTFSPRWGSWPLLPLLAARGWTRMMVG